MNITFLGKSLSVNPDQLNLFTGQMKEDKTLLPSKKNPNVRRWQGNEGMKIESEIKADLPTGILPEYGNYTQIQLEDELKKLESARDEWHSKMNLKVAHTQWDTPIILNEKIKDLKVRLGKDKYLWQRVFDDKISRLNPGYTIEKHKNNVEAAIKKGYKIPDEVLNQFPDLVEKYGKGKKSIATEIGGKQPYEISKSEWNNLSLKDKQELLKKIEPSALNRANIALDNNPDGKPDKSLKLDNEAKKLEEEAHKAMNEIPMGQKIVSVADRNKRERINEKVKKAAELRRQAQEFRENNPEEKFDGHKYIIEQGLKEGKPVYEDWQKDYPDLAEKYKNPDITEVKKTQGTGQKVPSEQKSQMPEGNIKIVGKDFSDTFLHGTKKQNIKNLTSLEKPTDIGRKESTSPFLPKELNEMKAEMYLSEFERPQQSFMFGTGTGKDALATVKLKPGTKVLDLSEDVTRQGLISKNPKLLFFKRPPITDDFINWYLSKISDRFKERHPSDWQQIIKNEFDPSSKDFSVDSWADNLTRYAKEKGIGAIRFGDEIIITDRNVLKEARKSTQEEIKRAQDFYDRNKKIGKKLFLEEPLSKFQEKYNKEYPPESPRTPKEGVQKSLSANVLKAFGQQIGMFGSTNSQTVSREGETKQGKGGQLVLRRDTSGKGAHWRLANKEQRSDVRGQRSGGPSYAKASEGETAQNGGETAGTGIRVLNGTKAYDMLSEKLGNKAYVTDKSGGLIGEGKFQLINENQDGTISLFMKDGDGESKIINIPQNQAVILKNNNVEFQFADKNIGISLTEQAQDNEPADQEEPDEDKMISDARKQEAWDNLANQYIDQAKAQKERYLQDLDEVSAENQLEEISYRYIANAIKSKGSILNKFERNEAKGQPQKNYKLTDVLRGTIIIKKPDQFNAIMDSLKKRGYEVYNNDINNLYEDKTPGYKHIAIKLTRGKGDGLVKELLLMTPAMYEAKFGFGHDLYDLDKNIDIALGNKIPEGHKLFPHLAGFKQDVFRIANAFYAKAYEADMKGEELNNYDSETSAAASSEPPLTQVSKKTRRSSSSIFSAPPKRLIRELRSSLKAIWQPLSASLRQSSGDIFSLADSSASIDSTLSSIVNPTKNIIKKYAGKVSNLKKSFKIKINISKIKSINS